MAQRTLTIRANKEQSLLDGSSPNSGSGQDAHIPVGQNASGQTFRGLLRFPIRSSDWAKMAQLVEARLRLRTSSGVHAGSSTWRNGTLRIGRLSGSFSSGGGAEGYWASGAATIWPGPGTGTTIDRSWPGSPSSWADRSILGIVEDWAPQTVLRSDGSPGLGRSNYGIRLAGADGLLIEYLGIRSQNDPELVITYFDSVAPVVILESPEPSAQLVRVVGAGDPGAQLGVELAARIEPGTGDTLAGASWSLRLSGGAEVASGICAGFAADGFDWLERPAVELEPGAVYVLEIAADGQNGGTTTESVSFILPVAQALHAIDLGPDPSNVGASVLGSPEEPPAGADRWAVHYARSSSPSTAGIDGSWSSTPPAMPEGSSWYLLVRSRVWRVQPDPLVLEPMGVDRVRVSWRGQT